MLTCLKLWRQLSLAATSLETSISSTQCHLITVFLAHSQAETEHARRMIHTLGHDTPFYDVQPPAGVCTAALDCVHLDIRIQTSGRYKQTKLKRRCNRSDTRRNSREGVSAPAKASIPDITVRLKPYEVELPSLAATKASTSPLSLAEWHLEPDDEEMIDVDRSMLLDADYEDRLRPKQHAGKAPSLLKRSSSTSGLETDKRTLCKEAILDMVDAAIRMAISDSRRQLANGISLTGIESFRHLAELVPTLWSPKYLPAIASRAVFLPTISHALDSVCARHAKSQKLDEKGLVLATNRLDTLIDPQVEISSPSAPTTCSLSLWRALQRRIYDPMTAKRLQPLSTTANATATDSEPQDEILDTSQEVFCCYALGEEEDGDVFLHEDELAEVDDGLNEDLFCNDEKGYPLAIPREKSNSGHRVHVAGIGGIGTGSSGRACEDDLLSICESLSSLPFTEDGFEDLEDCNLSEGHF